MEIIFNYAMGGIVDILVHGFVPQDAKSWIRMIAYKTRLFKLYSLLYRWGIDIMIKTKKQLREVLRCEKAQYYKKKSFIRLLSDAFINESCMEIWKYQRVLRLTEYHFNNKRNPMHVLFDSFYLIRSDLKYLSVLFDE